MCSKCMVVLSSYHSYDFAKGVPHTSLRTINTAVQMGNKGTDEEDLRKTI